MKKAIPEALQRVRVREDATLDAAARITVDYTGGANIAELVINPEHAPAEAVEGYRIRAAAHSILEPFRKYNRAVTRKHGAYEREQRLFDEAFERALGEIEQLVHLTPTGEAVPELAAAATVPEPRDEALPDDFPEVEGLRSIGIRTRQAVRDATDEELRAAPGVGPKRLEAVRAAAG